MAEAQFDPGGFYQFDLQEGSVRTKDGARVVVLSDTALAPLVSAAVKSGDIGALIGLGSHLGTLAKANLGANPVETTPEGVLAHASSVVSLFGWGKLGFERWGEALALTVDGAPTFGDGGTALGAFLTGLLSALGDQPADCVPVGERFLVVSPQAADQVRGWAAGGDDMPTIVGRMGVSS